MTLPGIALTESDFEALEHSWIDRASAEKALLRRVSSIDGAELVGQKRSNCAGIVFPNVWPGETYVREYRLRRDTPEVSYEKGERRIRRKYLGPPGRNNRLYIVPGTPAELLADLDLPVLLTEGEKKCIALDRLAYHDISDAADGPRFLPVGLLGVWSWLGTIGKETGPNGERNSVTGLLPDFSRMAWADRKVILAFDSDAKTNENVRNARRELARYLMHELGADVYFIEIPAGSAKEKVGIDDLLGNVGPEKVLKLINGAKRQYFKEKPASVLENAVGCIELFHTKDMQPYATVTVNGHRETWPINSKGFRNWLNMQCYRQRGKPASAQSLQETIAVCEARAQFDGAAYEVGVRLVADGENVYLDLANDDWQAIELNASGWRLVAEPPVKFRRAKGMASLPVPVSGSIEELRKFVNAGNDQNWILMVAWLVAALSPSGPFPILILQGEQGTGKSTVARVLRILIDPSTASLRSVPREERDLMIAAGNARILSFDNLSGIPHWLSDALCRLSTGGGFAIRELHTDCDEILFDATRPIILNGIDDIAGNADLADRCLIVTLPQVTEEGRIPEKLFWADFSTALPGILGGLLDAVSMALRNLDNTNLDKLPRMADFARWICAAAPALPFNQEAFVKAYSANRQESVSLSIEASPVAMAVQNLSAAGEWVGTATQLLSKLNEEVPEETRKSNAWPKNPRTLSSKIRRMAPVLRQAGCDVKFDTQGHQKHKLIWLAPKAV